MNNIKKIMSGIGILILLYLLFSQYQSVNSLINIIFGGAINGIKILQKGA